MSVGSRTTAGPWTGAPELAAAIERLLDAIDQGRGADVPAALTEVDRLTAIWTALRRRGCATSWPSAPTKRRWPPCEARQPRHTGPDRLGRTVLNS